MQDCIRILKYRLDATLNIVVNRMDGISTSTVHLCMALSLLASKSIIPPLAHPIREPKVPLPEHFNGDRKKFHVDNFQAQ